jgi:hypothetical protein
MNLPQKLVDGPPETRGQAFKGKASIRFRSAAYMLIREHFKPNRNEALGR